MEEAVECVHCGEGFWLASSLVRHQQSRKCPVLQEVLPSKEHQLQYGNPNIHCGDCGCSFSSEDYLEIHQTQGFCAVVKKEQELPHRDPEEEQLQRALKRIVFKSKTKKKHPHKRGRKPRLLLQMGSVVGSLNRIEEEEFDPDQAPEEDLLNTNTNANEAKDMDKEEGAVDEDEDEWIQLESVRDQGPKEESKKLEFKENLALANKKPVRDDEEDDMMEDDNASDKFDVVSTVSSFWSMCSEETKPVAVAVAAQPVVSAPLIVDETVSVAEPVEGEEEQHFDPVVVVVPASDGVQYGLYRDAVVRPDCYSGPCSLCAAGQDQREGDRALTELGTIRKGSEPFEKRRSNKAKRFYY